MKLVTVEEMRRIEQATDAGGHSYASMMEMAGKGVAEIAMFLGMVEHGENVLILVGPGNNGGDGLVAARFLRDAGHDVTVYIWKRNMRGDENLRLLKRRRRGVAILWSDNDPDFAKLREEIGRAGLIIDALLGTGVTRPIDGRLAEMLAAAGQEIIERRRMEAEEPAELPLGMPRFPLIEAHTFGMAASSRSPSITFDPRGGPEAGAGPDRGVPEPQPSEDDEDEWDEEWDDEEESLPQWPPLPVLAVDCPSGLNCDTGALDPCALPASITATFAYPKWGQLQFPGAGACGLLAVIDIGAIPKLEEQIQVELVEPPLVRSWLPARPGDAHKGTFGRAMIAGGSLSYTGAPALSAVAAMRAGAGLVTLAIPLPLHAVLAGALPEATWLPLPAREGTHCAEGAPKLLEGAVGYDALLVGPGLTTSEDARGFVGALFPAPQGPRQGQVAGLAGRIVVDADALNILAALPDWPARLPPLSILTPHPGEMGRLTGMSIAEVNGWRIENARRHAAQWGHIVLLKGAHTVVAAPDGRASVLPFAVPALAVAGSGDVLAGAVAAMLAQGLPPYEAAVAGAYLHGHAGMLVAHSTGPAGAAARDIPARFPEALRQLYAA